MTRDEGERRFPWWLGAVGGVFVLLVAGLVASSLRDRSPPAFLPAAGGDTAVLDSTGARRVTLDARDGERWVYFDVTAGRVHDAPVEGWDLAARRFHLIVNGGPALPGDAAAAVADGGGPGGGPEAGAPGTGWTATVRDEDGELRHPALETWYEYDFFSHLLTPAPRTYLLRTAEGAMVELRFLSYYCPGPEGGCVTFRYAPLPAGAGPAPGGAADGAPDRRRTAS